MAHRIALHAVPNGLVGIEVAKLQKRAGKRAGIDRVELQPGGDAGRDRRVVCGNDGVGKSARQRDDRDRALTQAVKLGQAARLET